MKKQFKLGVIGGGFMASAILKGVTYSDFIRPKKIIVADSSRAALEKLSYLGVNTTVSNRDAADNCEFLLFAVKPQKFRRRRRKHTRYSRRKSDQHHGRRKKAEDQRSSFR